jgi:RNA polymerase sigma-70 factor (ECF subfamily)
MRHDRTAERESSERARSGAGGAGARAEQQLIERARGGDAVAFRQLVEKYQERAFAVALGMVRNREDARDICQEAFLRMHRGIKTFGGEARIYTWLYRIIHNVAIDHLRRRRVDVVPLEALGGEPAIAADESETDPTRAIDTEERRERFKAALARLSAPHRAVLTLREVEGLSYKEIAAVVGCSIGTVMSRLFHARRRLLQALEAPVEALALAA